MQSRWFLSPRRRCPTGSISRDSHADELDRITHAALPIRLASGGLFGWMECWRRLEAVEGRDLETIVAEHVTCAETHFNGIRLKAPKIVVTSYATANPNRSGCQMDARAFSEGSRPMRLPASISSGVVRPRLVPLGRGA